VAITLPSETFIVPIALLYARALQSDFISFVKRGDPNVEKQRGTIGWPKFGKDKRIVDATLMGLWEMMDHQLPEDKCRFWQSAPYV